MTVNSNHINKDEDPNRIPGSAKEIYSIGKCSDNYVQLVGKMDIVTWAFLLLGTNTTEQ